MTQEEKDKVERVASNFQFEGKLMNMVLWGTVILMIHIC